MLRVMAGLALVCLAVYLLLAFGLRSVVMRSRTGSTGFKGVSGNAGSTEWWGGVLFAVALGLGALAPVLGLLGVLDPIDMLDGTVGHWAGAGLFGLGLVATLLAQFAMGDSWRIGVDATETTALVTTGPFRLVRNPIFTGMIPTSVGIALLVPNLVAVAATVLLFAALEIQTRAVEEPYLSHVHGSAYRDYARHAGRFLPYVGRLR